MDKIPYHSISFVNKEESLRLGGMAFVPEGNGPFDTVVIIQGSGPSRRGNKWYLGIADYLREHNIAVILPDKRGCDFSEGNWRGADFHNLASDASSAVDFVRSQSLFSYGSIGVMGMSQGGWIAPLVASGDDSIDFLISMSGAVVSTDEQLEFEEVKRLSRYTYPFIAGAISHFSLKSLRSKETIKPILGFDPVPYWKQIDIPVLFAFGEDDENVPVNPSIEKIELFESDLIEIRVYPDSGHGLIDNSSGLLLESYLDDLLMFIESS